MVYWVDDPAKGNFVLFISPLLSQVDEGSWRWSEATLPADLIGGVIYNITSNLSIMRICIDVTHLPDRLALFSLCALL